MAEHKIEISRHTKKGMILFFIDIDNMKRINDTFSHNNGDSALLAVSDIFKNIFSENDVIARIGGDEFAILSIGTSRDDLQVIKDKLMFKQDELNNKKLYPFNISMSVGAAYFDPENPQDIDQLMGIADQFMYEHKKSKKIRMCD